MKYGIEELREHQACFCSCQRWREFGEVLDLLEEGATIIEHLRKNIPRGWIVDWEDRINAFLDKLKKEKE